MLFLACQLSARKYTIVLYQACPLPQIHVAHIPTRRICLSSQELSAVILRPVEKEGGVVRQVWQVPCLHIWGMSSNSQVAKSCGFAE